MKYTKYIVSSLILLTALQSCKKDEKEVTNPPAPDNEEEVITTLRLEFEDVNGVEPSVSATFRDPDGDGGAGPDIFDEIVLQSGTTYQVHLLLLNETVSPADTISNEVLEEADEHLFCFSPEGLDLTIVRTDTDGMYELGLESDWTVGAPGNGTVKVELKHQPGIKDGSCEPGETDVEVTFEVTAL